MPPGAALRETAVIVAVPEAAPLVDPWRLRHTADAAAGVPAHITVLYPFVPADRVDDALLAALGDALSPFEPFRFSLRRVGRFPYIVYLAPDPAAPFRRLTEALVARWPEHPPYGGVHETVVPHLTIAHGDRGLQDEVERAVSPALPIDATAEEALLLERLPSGRWATRERLPLAG